MVHPNPLSTDIPADRKREILGTGYQSIPIFNKNKYRQDGIPHRQAQSHLTHHHPNDVLPELTMPPYEKGKEVGPTIPPVLEQKIPPPLDKYPSMGHIERSTDKHHSLHDPNSHTMVLCIQLWYQRIKNKVMAWHWYIPLGWHGGLTLNLLDLLDTEISIYMTIQKLVHISHILGFTDISSSLGRMQKSPF